MIFFRFINKLFATFFPFYISIEGVKIYYNSLDRFLACILWKYGLLEGFELKLFHSYLNETSVVLDIGSNMGLYSLTSSRKIKTGQIFAFEPDNDNFNILNKSIQRNFFNNIKLYPYAVSDKDEEIYIETSSFNSGNHQIRKQNTTNKLKTIKAISIDDFLDIELKVDVVKIDIQGAEFLALKGMQKLISRNPNVIVFAEYWIQGMRNMGIEPKAYIDFLRENNFNIYQIDNKNKRIFKLKYDDILTSDSMNQFFLNFILTKNELNL